jgi:hypothetical protein
MQKCTTGSMTVCPGSIALYDKQVLACEASLLLQAVQDDQQCRSLLINYKTPTLQRRGMIWIYHFPREQQVNIRCPREAGWVTYNSVLYERGIIHAAATCSIASNEIQTLPQIRGTDYARFDTPLRIYQIYRPYWRITKLPTLKKQHTWTLEDWKI